MFMVYINYPFIRSWYSKYYEFWHWQPTDRYLGSHIIWQGLLLKYLSRCKIIFPVPYLSLCILSNPHFNWTMAGFPNSSGSWQWNRGNSRARGSFHMSRRVLCTLGVLGVWWWLYSVLYAAEGVTQMHLEKTQSLGPPSSTVPCSSPLGVAIVFCVGPVITGTLNQFVLISVTWNLTIPSRINKKIWRKMNRSFLSGKDPCPLKAPGRS